VNNPADQVHAPLPLRVYRVHEDIGLSVGLEPELLYGTRSHAPHWHACSILEHIRWCTAMAIWLVHRTLAPEELVLIAAWHDVGKVLTPQFGPDGPTFHNHAESGAAFLKKEGLLPARGTALIQDHGRYRGLEYPAGSDPCLPLLDLCDELSKWSPGRFPPDGGTRQRERRLLVLAGIVRAGVPDSVVTDAANAAEDVADAIGLTRDQGWGS